MYLIRISQEHEIEPDCFGLFFGLKPYLQFWDKPLFCNTLVFSCSNHIIIQFIKKVTYMNPAKALYSIFAAIVLVMVAVFAMAVSYITYESSETHIVADAQVIIYGTPQCHYCKKTRKLLSANNVPFFEYDISSNRSAYQTFQRLEGRGTPLVIIDDQVIKGYNEPLMRKLLNIVDEPEGA